MLFDTYALRHLMRRSYTRLLHYYPVLMARLHFEDERNRQMGYSKVVCEGEERIMIRATKVAKSLKSRTLNLYTLKTHHCKD